MIFRIPVGRHRALPLRFGFWWRRNSFAWVVKFTDSCRYDLGNEDQFDTNKLVGIGYLPGHHKDSARFGWRYDVAKGQVELSAYCYLNGRREIRHICYCDIGARYRLELSTLASWYQFFVFKPGSLNLIARASIQHNHGKRFKYRLGVYFGGQAKAQHEMTIELKRGNYPFKI